MNVARVKNDEVWKSLRILFIGSALIFLINNLFGFDNALTPNADEIPRWQVLIHLHSGSIGWITLSVIGLALWYFSGQRDVSERYGSRVKTFSRLAIIFFAGYVISFGLAFSQRGGFFFLLPIFGIPSLLIIWTAAAFSVVQLGRVEVKTEPQLMVTAGLLVVSLGSLMGTLLGLENALETTIIPGADRIGTHAGVNDSYLILASSAIIAWILGRNGERYSRGALIQAITLGLAPLFIWLGLIIDQEMLAGLSAPLLLIGVILFAVRNLRGTFKLNPFKGGVGSWFFFGALWTVVWTLIFVYLINLFINNPEGLDEIPAWFFVLFAHAAFVGMMTNLILGVDSVRSQSARHLMAWAEPLVPWIINLGIIIFVAVKAADSRLGAIVMGIGVVLGVVVMVYRLWSAADDTGQVAAAGD